MDIILRERATTYADPVQIVLVTGGNSIAANTYTLSQSS
jgi:hypothetical protein